MKYLFFLFCLISVNAFGQIENKELYPIKEKTNQSELVKFNHDYYSELNRQLTDNRPYSDKLLDKGMTNKGGFVGLVSVVVILAGALLVAISSMSIGSIDLNFDFDFST